MAAVGSAVGLGNIFRFPGLAAKYGIWFIAAYTVFLALLGLPLLCFELYIGKNSSSGAGKALSFSKSSVSPLGLSAAANCFLVLICYLIFFGLVIKGSLEAFSPSPLGALDPLFLIVAGAVAVVSVGSAERLGKISEVGVIFSAAVLIVVAAAGIIMNPHALIPFFGVSPGIMLDPKFLEDVCGQVFFSLSLAVGVMIAYGSMLDKRVPLFKSGIAVCFFDMAVSLLSTVIYICLGGSEGATTECISAYPVIFEGFFGAAVGRAAEFFFFTGLALLCLGSVISYIKAVSVYFKREEGKAIGITISALLIGLFLLGSRYSAINFIDSVLLPPIGLTVGIGEAVFFSFKVPRIKFRPVTEVWMRFGVPFILLFLLLRKIFI